MRACIPGHHVRACIPGHVRVRVYVGVYSRSREGVCACEGVGVYSRSREGVCVRACVT